MVYQRIQVIFVLASVWDLWPDFCWYSVPSVQECMESCKFSALKRATYQNIHSSGCYLGKFVQNDCCKLNKYGYVPQGVNLSQKTNVCVSLKYLFCTPINYRMNFSYCIYTGSIVFLYYRVCLHRM